MCPEIIVVINLWDEPGQNVWLKPGPEPGSRVGQNPRPDPEPYLSPARVGPGSGLKARPKPGLGLQARPGTSLSVLELKKVENIIAKLEREISAERKSVQNGV
ncbi:hypothetical protein B0H11DRAFT_1905949 [Mycena galericulata]|nr:hypothetical protein B0H11DRAFT_1905949 [Mycena galericulata]